MVDRLGVRAIVGKNLRAARMNADPPWTLARLAVASACSPALLSRIEAGSVAPSLATLASVATALGTGVANLVDDGSSVRRAAALVDASRAASLIGRSPDLGALLATGNDVSVPTAWRVRALAIVAGASQSRESIDNALALADALVRAIGSGAPDWVATLARGEVAMVAGEIAWARGDAASAARRWGNGLAVVSPSGDIEVAWLRSLLARALARVATGTPVAGNAIAVAVESLAAISDPGSVAARIVLAPLREPPLDAALALAILAAAQVALADARMRLASPDGRRDFGASGRFDAPGRPDVPRGRHLR